MDAQIRKRASEIVKYGVNQVRETAVRGIMQGNKTGRVYRRGNVVHQASASGEYPASDEGMLVNKITTQLALDQLSGDVISRAEYSYALEFGTKKMGARPFMQPSLEQNRPKIYKRLRAIMKG